MSEQRSIGSIAETAAAPKTFLQKLLDGVETVGNKVPHPAVIFFILLALVILLSHLFHWLGTTVTYEVNNPQTHKVEETTAFVNSLLTADGIRFMLTSMVRNFSNFGPVAIILVVMVGVGLAEQAGLMTALIKKIVEVTPCKAVTWILVTLGVVSSIASDAGYLVLIPLGAAAFLSLGRHPLAGLAAAFAGVAGVFGVNVLIVPIDGILTEITNDAIHLLNPARSIALTANFYFAVVSSLVLMVVCSLVTERVVEPRLGEYRGEVPAEGSDDVSPEEARGAEVRALRAGGERHRYRAVDVSGGGPVAGSADRRDHGQLAVHGQPDCADHAGVSGGWDRLRGRREDDHEYGRRHHRRHQNLRRATITGAVGVLIVGAIPKWAIFAPIFVPLFMKLGIAPEVVLAAYRVGDSPPNGVSPLMPYFALIVVFAQRYQKDAGVGTVVAMMLPYGAAISVVWILLFLAWELLGLPFGPG
jgi:aminobenzoyl-glutamate transport protein